MRDDIYMFMELTCHEEIFFMVWRCNMVYLSIYEQKFLEAVYIYTIRNRSLLSSSCHYVPMA